MRIDYKDIWYVIPFLVYPIVRRGLEVIWYKPERAQIEKEKHDRIKRSLDGIVERGIDETLWNVLTNVENLPLGKTREYKAERESNLDYLQRIFRDFDFYYNENTIVANRRDLFLEFDKSLKDEKEEKRGVVLFEPHESDYNRITANMPIRTKMYEVRYRRFYNKNPRRVITSTYRQIQLSTGNIVVPTCALIMIADGIRRINNPQSNLIPCIPEFAIGGGIALVYLERLIEFLRNIKRKRERYISLNEHKLRMQKLPEIIEYS